MLFSEVSKHLSAMMRNIFPKSETVSVVSVGRSVECTMRHWDEVLSSFIIKWSKKSKNTQRARQSHLSVKHFSWVVGPTALFAEQAGDWWDRNVSQWTELFGNLSHSRADPTIHVEAGYAMS